MAGGSTRRRSPRSGGRRAAAEQGVLGLQQDGICWPGLTATWAGSSADDLAAAHRRAAQLVAGGWGAIEPDSWGAWPGAAPGCGLIAHVQNKAMPSTTPSDAALAAYCSQLTTREVVALAAGSPWAMAQALAVLNPPPLLGAGGGILPQQLT